MLEKDCEDQGATREEGESRQKQRGQLVGRAWHEPHQLHGSTHHDQLVQAQGSSNRENLRDGPALEICMGDGQRAGMELLIKFD